MQSGKKQNGKKLADEDRILWDMVRGTISPRHKYDTLQQDSFAALIEQQDKPEESIEKNNKQKNKSITQKPVNAKQQQDVKPRFPIHVFDRSTHRKIAKGRISIDGYLDLHGLSQEKAHALLLHFLQTANLHGFRHVLVITGKGRSLGSDGILRQSVPQWLSTMHFRLYVSAFEYAALHHGGHGALYIRLRRNISGLHL